MGRVFEMRKRQSYAPVRTGRPTFSESTLKNDSDKPSQKTGKKLGTSLDSTVKSSIEFKKE